MLIPVQERRDGPIRTVEDLELATASWELSVQAFEVDEDAVSERDAATVDSRRDA